MWVFRELSHLVPDQEKKMRSKDAKERNIFLVLRGFDFFFGFRN